MNREKIITMLEQHIARLESGEADAQVDPNEEQQQFMDDALEGAKELLRRVKTGDESAIQEVSDLLETG